MSGTVVTTSGSTTTVKVQGGGSQRITLDRRTVAEIANRRPATVVSPNVTPVQVDARDTKVLVGNAMGVQGRPGPSGSGTILLTAGTALDYPRIVAAADGLAYYPDLSDPDDVQRVVGVTLHAATQGQPIAVAPQSTFNEPMWGWVPGPLYCTVSSGQLTQTAPATGAVLEVGKALDARNITILIHRAILRS